MTHEANAAGNHPWPNDELIIDGQKYRIENEEFTGRLVLETAGRHPIDEHIVFWLGLGNVLEDLGLDETIRPLHHGVQEFFTFKSDRSYRFEIEGRREDWGAPFITEGTLRKLANARAECRVLQTFHDRPERVLMPGVRVDLTGTGIEKFRVECPTAITVVNEDNGKEFKLHGFDDTKIEALIEEMYKKFGLVRKDDDRLRCEGGRDVFQYAALTLGAYVAAGHCRCLVWLFAAGTGGAACR